MRVFHIWLAALTALRLALAAVVPLAPDEAYYWVWSRALAAGYVDHPPMVALFIRAGTTLAGDTSFGIRLLGPLATAAGSLLLADAGRLLWGDRRAGEAAALLLNATLLLGAGSVAMTPDTPLLLFWTAALWAAARLHAGGRGAWLLLAGLCAGLALDSKYTAVFAGFGIGLWLLLAQRRWLRTPWPWAGALLGAAVFAPVLAWNADHGWASFARQGGRIGQFSFGRAARFTGELVGGQVGLATPLIFVLFAAGLVAVTRRALRGESVPVLLASLTLPAAAVFAEHALGDRVQANWPAILYPALALSAASLTERRWLRLRAPAVALGFGLTALVSVQASLSPLALSPHVDPTMRQLGGWPELSRQVAALAEGSDFVVADDYGVAAELARGLPASIPVYAIDPRWALFDLPHPDLGGRTGLLLRSERRRDEPDAKPWARVERAGEAARVRDGVTAEAFRVYRVTGRPEAPADTSVAALPRPERP